MALLQPLKQLKLNASHRSDVYSQPVGSSERVTAAYLTETPAGKDRLMEIICERQNLGRALSRVRTNHGAAGIDGMTVDQLTSYLRQHWPKVRADLLAGTYQPLPVRRKEIPKPSGGVRLLGIPTALDRLVQQAVGQILQQIRDPSFSASSYGFRPGRNQHQAIQRAQQYVVDGCRQVVDMDLSKFFDRVNHDRLMSRLATKVHDKRVLKLVRRFLTAGVMVGGLQEPSHEGTHQGGPLSPLLSNIVLDELDKELEKRALRFVRYADGFIIFVRSKRAAERVMVSVSRFVNQRLRLKVNQEKSGITHPWWMCFLGFSFYQPSRRYPYPHPLQIDQPVQTAGAGTDQSQLWTEHGADHRPSQPVFSWLVELLRHNPELAQFSFASLLDPAAPSGDPVETLEEPENPGPGIGETEDPSYQGAVYGLFP